MQETIDINLKADIFQQLKELKEQFGQLNGKVSDIEKTSSKSFKSLSQSLKSISFVSITQGIQNLNQGLQDLNAPGLSFSSQLAEVSAITGVTGTQLESLGKKARESAKEFGGNASESLNTYKTILSRLGPDISKNETALALMERNVRVLSKTMGGDAVGSVDALTTAMLQYGVDLSDPIAAQKEMERMMNVMAAGAKEGAAEVPSISQALKVSGVAAKQANVSFEETNAALQALAAGGREGSEAGTSLRNVLSKIAGEDIIPKRAVDKLHQYGVNMNIVSNTSLPFATRLRELKKAQNDATLVAQIFGVENAAAANILLDSIDAQESLTEKITGTNTAQEQANVIMDTAEEKLKRMQAKIDDAKISFFEATGGATAFLEPVSQVAITVSSFVPLFSGASTVIKTLATSTKITTAAQWLWNAAMTANPIGLLITGVAALGVGVYALSKAFDTSTVSERLNAQVKDRIIDKTVDEQVQLRILFDKLKNAKKGTDDYRGALKDLEDKYPGIIEKYDLQKGKIDDIIQAEKDLRYQIKKRAEEQVIGELYQEKLKEIEISKNDGPNWFDAAISKVTGTTYWQRDLNSKEKEAKALLDKLTKFEKKKSPKKKEGEETDTEETETPPAVVSPSGAGKQETKVYNGANGGVKNINIKIENLVKDITVSTTNLPQGLGQIKQQITEALIGSVRDVEVSL